MRYAVKKNGVVVVVFVEWNQILISFKREFKVLCAMVDASTLMIPCLETQMNAKVHHYGEKCNVNKFHQTLPNVNVYIPSNLVQIHGTIARCEWGNDGELTPPRRRCAGMQPRRDGCGRWRI